jgi:hypothetical protein
MALVRMTKINLPQNAVRGARLVWPAARFKKAAMDEFLKKLREEEPSKTSASLRTRAESARTELAKRCSGHLSHSLRDTVLPTIDDLRSAAAP